MPHRSKLAVLAGALVLALVPATAAQGDSKNKQECKKNTKSKSKKCKKTVKSGRMTGHGHEFVAGYGKVQWEFRNMLCKPAAERLPDLKVEYPGFKFVLTRHISGPTCTDEAGRSEGNPEAGFDTMKGQGSGTVNGVNGATITYEFSDEGEPGRGDFANFTITAPDGSIAYIGGALHGGNHQAHRLTGADAR